MWVRWSKSGEAVRLGLSQASYFAALAFWGYRSKAGSALKRSKLAVHRWPDTSQRLLTSSPAPRRMAGNGTCRIRGYQWALSMVHQILCCRRQQHLLNHRLKASMTRLVPKEAVKANSYSFWWSSYVWPCQGQLGDWVSLRPLHYQAILFQKLCCHLCLFLGGSSTDRKATSQYC